MFVHNIIKNRNQIQVNWTELGLQKQLIISLEPVLIENFHILWENTSDLMKTPSILLKLN